MNHKQLGGKRGVSHYWTNSGGDTCIVFTHGATMDHGMFHPQEEYFSNNYKVINWDVPLHGLSRPYENFSLQNSANELINILDAESVRRAHFVGQSMGGYIIQIVALNHPERVITLTVVDSSPIQPSYYSSLDKWLLSITPTLLKLFPYKTLINSIAKQIALTKPAQEYALETLKGLTKAEIVNIMRSVYQGLSTYDRDYRLPLPLLIVYGNLDSTGKVRSYCDRWAERETRELRTLPNAAHNSNMDNPEGFNRVLDEFFKKQKE